MQQILNLIAKKALILPSYERRQGIVRSLRSENKKSVLIEFCFMFVVSRDSNMSRNKNDREHRKIK